MTGIADDVDAVLELVIDATKRLKAKEPTHELLQYVTMGDDEEVYTKFVARFGDKDVPEHLRSNALNVGKMYAKYFAALKEALGEAPKPKVDPPRILPEVDEVPEVIPF